MRDKQTQTNIWSRQLIVQSLDTTEKNSLRTELFDLCGKIFANITYDEFCHYITDSKARKTYLRLFYNSDSTIVGFFALHIFDIENAGKNNLIFRAQTGLLPHYRRSRANMYFSLFIILKYRILNPLTSIYCFLAVLSPSMYHVLAKNLAIVIPSYKREPSQQTLSLVNTLKQAFGFDKEEEGSMWTAHVNWISIASDDELSYWNKSESRHIKYYLKNNPEFRKGTGLITLIPFSWKNIVLSSAKVTMYISKKVFK